MPKVTVDGVEIEARIAAYRRGAGRAPTRMAAE